MQRFELKNSFGWTFFVLIVASFWNNAAVKFDASPSSAPAVASRSTSDVSSATLASTAPTFDSESAAFSRDVPEPTPAFFEASSVAVRRVQDSTRRRLDSAPSSFSGSQKLAIRAFASGSSTFFRSFWACQSASRPLFLTLRSLRN